MTDVDWDTGAQVDVSSSPADDSAPTRQPSTTPELLESKGKPGGKPGLSGHVITPEERRKGIEVRIRRNRERKEARERATETAHLTYRQRIGLALSQLSQEELNAHVKALSGLASQGDAKSIHALARLSDQAFGRAQVEAATDGRDTAEKQWDELTPAEKSALRADAIARIRAQATAANDDSDPRADFVTRDDSAWLSQVASVNTGKRSPANGTL